LWEIRVGNLVGNGIEITDDMTFMDLAEALVLRERDEEWQRSKEAM
jgi:hypothetical protein